MSKKNPWPGMATYEDGDGRKFCGRDDESYDVTRLIDNHLFVTLYGKSGIGKSSLLKAGVFPRLYGMGYLPVIIRLGTEADKGTFQACIVGKLRAALGNKGTESVSDIVRMPEDESDEIWLWSLFARTRFSDPEGKDLFPVLVFDQFEEVFRTRPHDAAVLLRQVYFMMDRVHALPDTEGYRYSFNFRFVVSIREDELYRLEDCIDGMFLHEMKNCRFRLRGLTEKEARKVILIPGSCCMDESDKEGIADDIIRLSRSKEEEGGSQGISPSILSLICSRAYDEMVRQNASAINRSLLGSMESENIFEKYYLEATEGFPAKARAYIEDHLVDGSERRNSVPEEDFGKAVPGYSALLEDGSRKILQRIATASGGNRTRIELIHDNFCPPLAGRRRKRNQNRRSFLAAGFALLALLISAVSFSVIYSLKQREWKMLENQSRFAAEEAMQLIEEGDFFMARRLAADILPQNVSHPDRPYIEKAEEALWKAWRQDGAILRKQHQSRIEAVAFSSDGKQIVSCDEYNSICFWNAGSGTPTGRKSKADHKAIYDPVAFSPDLKWSISGYISDFSHPKASLQLTDIQKGKPVGKPWKAQGYTVEAVAFSPDGKRIVSGGNVIQLWDVQTGKTIGEPWGGHEGIVTALAFSPDGKRVISGGHDNIIRLWDAVTGKPIGDPWRGHSSYVDALAFSPDGKRVVSGDWDGNLRLWDAGTGKPIGNPWTGHTQTVRVVVFSPDGERVVSGDWDGTLRLWDATTGEPVGNPWHGHKLHITAVTFSPDGKWVVSGSEDQTIRLWDAKPTQTIGRLLEGHEAPKDHLMYTHGDDGELVVFNKDVTAVTFSPDGKSIVSGGQDYTLRRWDAATGSLVGEPWIGHKGTVSSISFSPDGRQVVSCSTDSTILLWDAKTGKTIGQPWTGHEDRVNQVAFSPDGTKVLSCSDDHTIRLWDAKTGKTIGHPWTGHDGSAHQIAFSPDGRWAVSGGTDWTIRLWDVQTGEPVWTIKQRNSAVAFSPDGRFIVSADDYYNTFRLWDVSTGKPLGKPWGFEGSPASISSMAVFPDGKRLVSGGKDNIIRLWDIQTGSLIGKPWTGASPIYLEGATYIEGWFYSIAVSPDGKMIAAASEKGLRTFPALSLQELLDSTRKAFPALSHEERQRYYLE